MIDNLVPETRRELFLAQAAGQETEELIPMTREERWLEAIARGGGGGGVLVCTLDTQTMALDKTWAEINDADLAFVSFNMGDTKCTGLVALTIALESEYKVEVITIDRDMSIGTLHFAAESADGYPVVSQ